jgi:ABC-type Fe3+-hydroxamate transport system substrate-binding protein
MRVVVCGGRDFTDSDLVFRTLNELHDATPITDLAHGGAPGADTIAGQWMLRTGRQPVVFLADWGKHGRAAGPIRNAKMLAELNPDLVVAFPGGRGTADMVAMAKAAGVKVMEVKLVLL